MSEKFGTDLQEKEEVEIKRPKMYNVVLLNDDYTTMDFVISVLVKIFGKTIQEAEAITMDIHYNKKRYLWYIPKNHCRNEIKKDQ